MWRRLGEPGRRAWVLVAPLIVIFSAAGLMITMTSFNSSLPILGRLLIVLLVVCFLVGVRRLFRIGVYTSGKAFRIINPLKSRIVQKVEVAAFDLEEVTIPMLNFQVTAGVVVMRDGTRLPIWALMLRDVPLPSQVDAAHATLASLNSSLAEG
jgi:hypothetical protein